MAVIHPLDFYDANTILYQAIISGGYRNVCGGSWKPTSVTLSHPDRVLEFPGPWIN